MHTRDQRCWKCGKGDGTYCVHDCAACTKKMEQDIEERDVRRGKRFASAVSRAA